MKRIVLALTLVFPAACSDILTGGIYERVNVGELKGRLVVEWVDQDKFLFLPDPQNPLRFTRKNSDVIEPQRMFTDGGTIPAALRAIKSYSPWGYAPGFIIHDWLFAMHHCKVPGHEKYDVEAAAEIMAEVLKTMMENPKYGGPNKLVHYSMYEAVRSNIARDYWTRGTCETAEGARTEAGPAAARSGRRMAAPDPAATSRPRFVIEF